MKIDELRRRFKHRASPPEGAGDGHDVHTYASVDINDMLPDAQLVTLAEAAARVGWPGTLEVTFDEGHFVINLDGDTFRLPFTPSDDGVVVTIPGWSKEVRERLRPADKDKGTVPVFTIPAENGDAEAAKKRFDEAMESGLVPSPYTLLLEAADIDEWSVRISDNIHLAGWPPATVGVSRDVHKGEMNISIVGPKQRADIVVTDKEIDAAMDASSMGVVEVIIPAYMPVEITATPPGKGTLADVYSSGGATYATCVSFATGPVATMSFGIEPDED